MRYYDGVGEIRIVIVHYFGNIKYAICCYKGK